MTDTRNPYCAAKRPHLHVVETTTPKPGQIILMRHGAYRVNDRGGYEYVGRSPIAPIPGPAPLLVNAHPQWPSLPVWALMGLAMGLLVVWGIVS